MLSLWNLYPLLLDFVVKVKVKAARLNATVIVVVEEKLCPGAGAAIPTLFAAPFTGVSQPEIQHRKSRARSQHNVAGPGPTARN